MRRLSTRHGRGLTIIELAAVLALAGVVLAGGRGGWSEFRRQPVACAQEPRRQTARRRLAAGRYGLVSGRILWLERQTTAPPGRSCLSLAPAPILPAQVGTRGAASGCERRPHPCLQRAHRAAHRAGAHVLHRRKSRKRRTHVLRNGACVSTHAAPAATACAVAGRGVALWHVRVGNRHIPIVVVHRRALAETRTARVLAPAGRLGGARCRNRRHART